MQENQKAENQKLLPLDLPERHITWQATESGQIRTHIFRRLTAEDWAAYFAAITIEADRESRLVDVDTAALKLYDRAAVRAEGYSVAGGATLESLPNWKSRIRPGHRIQAVDQLTKVTASEDAKLALVEPDVDVVALDAAWSASAPGLMTNYKGLLHRFTPPSVEHQQRYSRETKRSTIVGGSRTGRTIYPVKEKILLKLYDELIQSVDGYSVGGEALTEREAICREMDAFHKVAAAGQLFSTLGEEEAES